VITRLRITRQASGRDRRAAQFPPNPYFIESANRSPAAPSRWLMALRRALQTHSFPVSRLKVGYSMLMIWLSIAQAIAKAASANLP
jgi:hypothetical protein